MGSAQGFPAGVPVNAVCIWNNQLVFGAGNKLYRLSGSVPEVLVSYSGREIRYLTAEGAGLMAGWYNPANFGIGTVEYLETDGTRSEIHGPCNAEFPLYGIESGNRQFWLSDQNDGFRVFDKNKGTCEQFTFNSPYRHIASDISIAGNKVYIATRAPDPIWSRFTSFVPVCIFTRIISGRGLPAKPIRS